MSRPFTKHGVFMTQTGLFYKEVNYRMPETKQVELKIPRDWGMFTPQGNRSLRLKAEKLVLKVKENESTMARLNAFVEYFKGYRKLSNTKTMSEAGDTMVREMVWSFAVALGRCVGVSDSVLDNLWNSKDSHP
jgi:hypothetical protein